MTNVGVLEWACCGGLFVDQLQPEACPFLGEGRSMLATLLEEPPAGTRCHTIIDRRIAWNARSVGSLKPLPELTVPAASALISAWLDFASEQDACLIVVPECEHLLERTIGAFSAANVPLINCQLGLVQMSADKWKTDQFLRRHELPHIPTQLLSARNEEWILEQSQIHSSSLVIKPRLGAGGDGIQICDAASFRGTDPSNEAKEANQLIIQPWISGESLSCSAIIDCGGVWHWLPPVTQQLEPTDAAEGVKHLKYAGGKTRFDLWHDPQLYRLLSRLEEAVHHEYPQQALGWFSVDLIKRTASDWCIVELNPRCTTSISVLQRASHSTIASRLLEAGLRELPRRWCTEVDWQSAEIGPTDLSY